MQGLSGQEEAGGDRGKVPENWIKTKSIMFSGTYQDSADTQNLLELLFMRFEVWNRARNLFETRMKKIK